MGVETDLDLAARASKGDRNAFSELVRRHQPTVRGMTRRLSGGHQADADDLSQAAFLKAWSQIGSFAGGTFRSWVCTIAYREFLQVRRKGRAQSRIVDATKVLSFGRYQAELSGVGQDLDKALSELPNEQRIALVLSISAGLSHGEVAVATGWPIGTVKSHIARGKSALQKRLKDYDVA